MSASIADLSTPESATILVTHYERILAYVVPDRVHVLVDGAIAASGGKELASEVEAKGYEGFSGRNGA